MKQSGRASIAVVSHGTREMPIWGYRFGLRLSAHDGIEGLITQFAARDLANVCLYKTNIAKLSFRDARPGLFQRVSITLDAHDFSCRTDELGHQHGDIANA